MKPQTPWPRPKPERTIMGMNEMPKGKRPPVPPAPPAPPLLFAVGCIDNATPAIRELERTIKVNLADCDRRAELCRQTGRDWQAEQDQMVSEAALIREWIGDGKAKTYTIRNTPYDVCYQGPPADYPATDPRHGTTDAWGIKDRYTLYPSGFPWWMLAATLGGLATIGWILANG